MLDHLHPFAGSHAIESATISIGWGAGQVDRRVLDGFLLLENEFRAWGYADSAAINVLRVEYTGQQATTSSQEIAGHVFRKADPMSKTVKREVVCRDNQFAIAVSDYVRWDALWDDITPIVSKLLELLERAEKRISLVALQYTDRFTYRLMSKDFPTDLVLQDSAFLPLKLLAKSPQWHSNQGFYVDSAVQRAGKRLDNVIITLGMDVPFPALSLVLVHQYSDLSQHGGIVGVNDLMPLMTEAHDANKGYLMELLTPAVCKKINLVR